MKRGVLQRRTRIKPKVRNWKKELDKLCREVVFLRDGHKCVMCEMGFPGGGGVLQWCHVQSRRYLSVRWDTRNSFAGCAGHHLFWHHRPLEAVRWWEKFFPDRSSAIRWKMATPQKVDRELIKLQLELERKKLEA